MTREFPTNELIREVIGEKHPIALGWQILIRTHNFGDNFLTSDGQATLLERPDISKERDEYQLAVGQILAIGSAAFQGHKFLDWDIKPEIGDFVRFYKYEGTFDVLNGVKCQWLQDAHIIGIIPDPSICNYIKSVGN